MRKLIWCFRLCLMPSLMAIVLILSIIFPASVLADDNPPTPPPSSNVINTPDLDSTPTDNPVFPAPQIESTPTDEPVLATSVDSAITTTDDSLSRDGTEVTASADNPTPNVLNGTLPIWCPAGVDPIPGQDGCTAEFGTMSLLMDYLNQSGLANDGKIWISQVAPSNNNGEYTSSDGSEDSQDQTSSDNNVDNNQESGVNIVILDGSGNPTNLDDEATANALLNGQPIWCPDGITPDTNDNCTSSVESLGLLVSMMQNGDLNNGTIYVQSSSTEGQEVVDSTSADHRNDNPEALVTNESSGLPQNNNETGNYLNADQVNDAQPVSSTTQADATDPNFLSDPIWCPDSIAPIASSGGCTASFLDLDTLVAFLQANQPTSNGTIWMENVTFTSTTPIVIDGSASTTWATNSLTFQGGWTGGGTTSSISGNTTLSQSISVVNWSDKVSIKNLVVQGGSTGNGITIQSTGDVSIDSVTSNNNTDISPNGYGINITADGAVSIKNTTANNNRVGIRVNSNGAGQPVALDTVSADGNNGTSIAVFSGGDISAQNISANNNGSTGLRLANSGGSGTISIFGTNNFDNNGGVSIFADSAGDINIQNVTVTSSPSSNGMSLTTPADIVVACSAFTTSSPFFGFDASNFSTLQVNGVNFLGPGGSYTIPGGSGTVTANPSCTPSSGGTSGGRSGQGKTFLGTISAPASLNVINLAQDDSNSYLLNCTDFGGTQLNLLNGDRVAYLCPTTGEATLMRVEDEALPGVLANGMDFISGLSTTLKVHGVDQAVTPGQLDISFVIPVDMVGFDVAILYWDGTTWQNLSTGTFSNGRQVLNLGTKTQDGRFEATTNFTGIFVLVRK